MRWAVAMAAGFFAYRVWEGPFWRNLLVVVVVGSVVTIILELVARIWQRYRRRRAQAADC